MLLRLQLRNCNSKHSIVRKCGDLVSPGILRQPETPKKLAAAVLHDVPFVGLLFFLYLPLAANGKDLITRDGARKFYGKGSANKNFRFSIIFLLKKFIFVVF
jgi:hypothetical protein